MNDTLTGAQRIINAVTRAANEAFDELVKTHDDKTRLALAREYWRGTLKAEEFANAEMENMLIETRETTDQQQDDSEATELITKAAKILRSLYDYRHSLDADDRNFVEPVLLDLEEWLWRDENEKEEWSCSFT